MNQNPQDLLTTQKTINSFDQVYEQIIELHDLNLPDRVVDMDGVKIRQDGNKKNPGLLFDVPNMGMLSLTKHSERQLGSILGCHFDKWFDPKIMKPEEVQQELQTRFNRRDISCKVRARKHPKGSPATKYCDGFARAFLGSSYSPIDDIRIFSRLKKQFGAQMEGIRFIKDHLGTDYYNDRASHFTVVSEPINLGPINRKHANKRVRDIYDIAEREGELPDADWIYQGYHIRNSEVGYTAITIDSTTFRLVCLNGCIISVKDGRLLYRQHRNISDADIDVLLDGAFRKMPTAWEHNKRNMEALHDVVITEPDTEIKGFLEKAKAGKGFIKQVQAAYREEPLGNAYGIWAAITRAAQIESDMEKRQELEEFGGRYLVQTN
ncbi:MAG: DUF932 domain-containing protein [Candidatus Eisenbacteria sp.]|nr:DUF932 domain-containing protein [Candidatus Eisenbacteria bacterium]